jgi:membrane fusion protein (multidrug efflux system)
MNKIKAALIISFASFLLSSCSKEDQSQSAAPQSMPPMPVSVMSVSPTSIPISVESVAQTEGAKEVEIRPRVGGILIKKLFEEGAPIKKGQAMFLIDPIPFQIALSQANAQLAQQKAQVVQASRESARLVKLLEMQSISQREADNATSDYAMASAGLIQYEAKVREAKLNLSYTKVTSPISGIAGRFAFSEGALVNANTSLLTTVSQMSPIWVRFSVSDTDLAILGGHLSEDNVKPIELTMQNGEVYAEKGKLNFAASTINPQLGTQQLRATFNNKDKRLMPGQFVRVHLSTGNQDGVFTIPQAAVQSGELGKYVYVVDENDVVVAKPITVGDWVGKDWVVNSGLVEGDQVIVDNLIKLRPGAKVSPHPFGEPVLAPTTAASKG